MTTAQIKKQIRSAEKEIARHTKQIVKIEAQIAVLYGPLELARKMRALAEESMVALREQLRVAGEE